MAAERSSSCLISSPTRFIASICAEASCLFFFSVGDLLRRDVALVLQRFDLRDGTAPLGVELDETVEVDGGAAVLQRLSLVHLRSRAGIHGQAWPRILTRWASARGRPDRRDREIAGHHQRIALTRAEAQVIRGDGDRVCAGDRRATLIISTLLSRSGCVAAVADRSRRRTARSREIEIVDQLRRRIGRRRARRPADRSTPARP